MNIDRDTLICGVKPVRLKALVGEDRFDTLRAMSVLGMGEPHISETLRQLAEAGWLSWDGDRNDIDQWRSTRLGHRLTASRLIRRFPIARGRALLPKIVDAARALNANPNASHRITEIMLFGSILTGEEDGDAGDIDLVVRVSRRKLPKDVLNALIEAEEQAMPRSLDFFQRLERQERDLKRAIKKVSAKISLHGFGNVETFSAPHRQLYRYNVSLEAEVAPDPEVRVVYPDDKPDPEEDHILPPPLAARAWPVAPNRPVILEPMDAAPLRRAQHLWVNGVDAGEIAKHLALPAPSIMGSLASRNDVRDYVLPTFDVSLGWMIDQAFDRCLGYAAMVEIDKRHGSDVRIECRALDSDSFDGVADIRIYGSDTWISGRCDLQPMLEPVALAASAWWDKMRDRFVGLDVRLFVLKSPVYDRVEAFGSRRPDFRSLVAPMQELLERRLPTPLGLDSWNHSIELMRERGQDKLFHRIGKPGRAGSVARLISRRDEPGTWRQIRAVFDPQSDFLRALGDFALRVEAHHIDGIMDVVRSSRLNVEAAVANRTGG